MLPFLKQKAQQSGVIIHERKPDTHNQTTENPNEDLEAVAEDILRYINMKDIKGLATALKSAFEICDAQPHTEGEHLTDSDESEE